MSDEFEYFDGRHICPEVYEHELHAVTIHEQVELFHHDGRVTTVNAHVEPLEKALYPRPIERVAEAKAAYVNDELTERQFEAYLESLADETQLYGGLEDSTQ